MKNVLKNLGFLALLIFSIVSIVSCSKDDDPTDNDFFAGTYNGHVLYTNTSNGTNIETNSGKVFVTKIASGTKYNFAFSNNIPALNGIEFQQTGDHTLISVNSTASVFIRIDNNDLRIEYLQGTQRWSATCSR